MKCEIRNKRRCVTHTQPKKQDMHNSIYTCTHTPIDLQLKWRTPNECNFRALTESATLTGTHQVAAIKRLKYIRIHSQMQEVKRTLSLSHLLPLTRIFRMKNTISLENSKKTTTTKKLRSLWKIAEHHEKRRTKQTFENKRITNSKSKHLLSLKREWGRERGREGEWGKVLEFQVYHNYITWQRVKNNGTTA